MAKKPIAEHRFHDLTDAELRYIIKDAGAAALNMRGFDAMAEAKYLDQVNDAQTVLAYRGTLGNVPTTCIEHAYGSAQRLSFQIKVF